METDIELLQRLREKNGKEDVLPFKHNPQEISQGLRPQPACPQPIAGPYDPFIVVTDDIGSHIPSAAFPQASNTASTEPVVLPEVPTPVVSPGSSPSRDVASGVVPPVHESHVGTRKSSKASKTPAWLNEFIHRSSKPSSSISTYPLSNYMSYAALSDSYYHTLCNFSAIKEPNSYEEALHHPVWVDAMNQELQALSDNQTWDLVPLPSDKRAIGCKWVFKTKFNAQGLVERYKVKLVAKGYTQQEGLDYHETFSPIVKMVTVRAVLSLAAMHNWRLHQMDVFNAFLRGI